MITNFTLRSNLEKVKIGQYSRIEMVFKQICVLDAKNLKLPELESIYGIGPKTARFFLLHSFPDQNYAVLDTHILAWMREVRKYQVPKSTPSGKKYLELEGWFLFEAHLRDMTPAELDILIWNQRSHKFGISNH